MDIINIIDRLETLIETSKTMPVSGSIMVDRKKAMELVDQLRLAIPQEIRAAEEVLSQKDHIVREAQADARRTRSSAEEEYRQRLENSDLVALAESRAEDTLRDAQQKAGRMLQQTEAEARSRRTEADTYALRSLQKLEKELKGLSESVQKGIEVLALQAADNLNGDHAEKDYVNSERR
jgi:vacuolar-type H+-ATPase subunit H